MSARVRDFCSVAHPEIGMVTYAPHSLHTIKPCKSDPGEFAVQFGAGSVSQLTLGYNVARLHEANGELKQAETVYTVCMIY